MDWLSRKCDRSRHRQTLNDATGRTSLSDYVRPIFAWVEFGFFNNKKMKKWKNKKTEKRFWTKGERQDTKEAVTVGHSFVRDCWRFKIQKKKFNRVWPKMFVTLFRPSVFGAGMIYRNTIDQNETDQDISDQNMIDQNIISQIMIDQNIMSQIMIPIL